MKARPAIVYSVLRILAFLVPFGILMLFPVFQDLYWLAAIFAALIGLSLSLLFLRRPLAEATSGLGRERGRSLRRPVSP
ncbi:MAG: mechanosensitive ion channel protein MscS [Microbacterium sp.]|nr:mechanosensitive ion channel protein MscS [Microbacterium sp.]